MEATIRTNDRKTFQSLLHFLRSINIEVITNQKMKISVPKENTIDAICGKYKKRLSSSKVFARRKQKEIRIER
jgi:hypothetical protein